MQEVEVKINKLGPIENSSIEFSDLMIFSGDSGLGKSYVSSLAHYLYALLSSDNRILSFFKEKYISTSLLQQIVKSKENALLCELEINEIEAWVNKDAITYVQYLIGNSNLEGDVSFNFNKTEKIQFFVNQVMSGLIDSEEVSYVISCNKEYSYSITSSNPTEEMVLEGLSTLLTAYLKKILQPENDKKQKTKKKSFFYEVFLMPPSRGALLDIANLTTLASRSSDKILFRAGMYTEFIKNYEKISSVNSISETQPLQGDTLPDLLRRINKGTIKQNQTGLTYEIENGYSIPLCSAAASIKELAPLSLFLTKKILDETSSIWFEEPEAHLHPIKQTLMADLVGDIINRGCHMQITTHSDYFLQRMSNLMRLYKLYTTNKEKALNIMKDHNISINSLINPSKVKTYYLVQTEFGKSKIIENSTEFGIRFDSFKEAIKMDVELTNDLLT